MKKKLLLLAAFALTFSGVNAQQVLGEFPTMDGGIEGQAAKVDASSTRTSSTWSISANASATVRDIVDNYTLARTGSKYLSMQMATTVTNCRFNSPTITYPTAGYLGIATGYTIQFFYKASVDLGSDLTGGVYTYGTASGSGVTSSVASAFEADKWVKATVKITTGSLGPTETFGVIRMGGTGTTSVPVSGNNTTLVDYDDFVVYAGDVDVTAPNIPNGPSSGVKYSRSGTAVTLNWAAPSGGVDGGGYVIVRFPTAGVATDLNQNGIYAVGNSVGTGTVVYIGKALSYVDTVPSAMDYYYKIYAGDKAFNYSDELLADMVNLSVSQNEISGLNVYPNPVSNGVVYINTSNSDSKSVEVYDVLGKQLIKKVVTNGTLDVSGLNKGVYIMKVTEGAATSTKKIVIE